MSEILPINIENKPEATNASGFDLVGHKNGEFTRLKLFDSQGKLKSQFVNQNVTVNNNSYTLDPEQIVPSEALYNDTPETLAGDVLKRVDKVTGEDVNYREVTLWHDGTAMTDEKVDGIMYKKKGVKYYVDTEFAEKRFVEINKYGVKGDNTLHTISEIFPTVTLAQVQAMDATATLSSSADWYIIQRLMDIMPVNSTIILNGQYIIDREIILKRSHISIVGNPYGMRSSEKYIGKQKSRIKQITANAHGIKIIAGDGITDSLNYVQQIKLQNFNIEGSSNELIVNGNGIDINLTGGATVIDFWAKDVHISGFRNGFYHTAGHINNFFFENCAFSYNYDNGFILNSSGQDGQCNWFTLADCAADGNGFDVVGGALVDYVNNPLSPDYNKGTGFKISGTSHNLRIGGHVNNGAGVLIPTYLFGALITGYFEGSDLGDIVCLAEPHSIQNVIINPYAMNQSFVFSYEETKRKTMPYEYGIYNEDIAKKEWSKNVITDSKVVTHYADVDITRTINGNGEAELSVLGSVAGNKYIFLPTDPRYKVNSGDIWEISFDFWTSAHLDNGLVTGVKIGANTVVLGAESYPINEWFRVKWSYTVPDGFVNEAMLAHVQRYGETADIKVRNISFRKLEGAGDIFRTDKKAAVLTAPAPTTQTASYVQADVQSISTRLENLIQNLKDADILSTL